MSAEFSVTISKLRKEKNISQKEAANALGISQALLSHYENGIRECNQDFIKKAAAYYNVTTDFLLGFNSSKNTENELFNDEELASDSSINLNTILRSLIYLSDIATNESEEAKIFFDSYFSLAIKKYISMIQNETENTGKLCDIVSSLLNIETKEKNYANIDKKSLPLQIKTIEQFSNMLINKNIKDLL